MSSDRERFLRTLFRPDEFVSVGAAATETRVYTLEQAIELQGTNLVSANPLDGYIDHAPVKSYHLASRPRRADANVTSYRNFVFEFDGATLDEQARILTSREVPYATLTYSGGKSLHAIVALSEPVTDELTYRALFNTIRDILWMTDPSCVNPSRFTRIGGATRDSGVEQELIDVRRDVSLFELKRWIQRFEKHLTKVQERRLEQHGQRQAQAAELQASGAAGVALLSESEQRFLAGNWDGKGSRHTRLVAITYRLAEYGVSQEEAEQLVMQAHVLLGIDRDEGEAINIVEYVYGRV